MLRLTSDLLARSPVLINALNLRELDLRGNRLQVIENLGMTQDEYEAIDLSDNEITMVENFPVLKRLLSLFVCNNQVKGLRGLKALPRLETLVLTNNDIRTLADLKAVGELPQLRHLSLLQNPVTRVQHYRAYLLFKCPNLEVLDFQKVRRKERFLAQKLFSDEAGIRLLASLEAEDPAAAAAAAESANSSNSSTSGKRGRVDAAEEALRLRVARAIQTARTLDEVAALQRALQEQNSDRVLALLEQIEAGADAAKRTKTTE